MRRSLRISRLFLPRSAPFSEQEVFQEKRNLRIVGGKQSVGVPRFG
ncbi:hypothetical protein [Paraburkholderia sp. BCC1885]|nr:hypothetical protein [Paraburkholderia sp. BCC1885]